MSPAHPLQPAGRRSTAAWVGAATVVLAALLGLSAAPRATAQEPPPNVPVTDTSFRAYQGPWLVVNPDDPDQLAVSFQDGNSLPTCWLALSYDGGDSWTQVPMVGQDALEPLPEGHTTCFRTSVAYGPDGTVHYAYTAGSFGFPAYNAIYLMTSHDEGETFGEPVPIDVEPLPAPGNTGDVTPRLATDPADGRVYVAWQQIAGNPTAQDVLVAASDDEGQTFSTPVRLNAPTGNAGPPKLAVGPGGRVYVTFAAPPRPADPARPLAVQVATSTDRGLTFGPPVTAQAEFNCTLRGPNSCLPATDLAFEGRGTNGPGIAAGASENDLYLVSYGLESREGDDVFRVRFSISRNGGANWSPARTVGVPPGLEDHHQIVPTIARAPNGRLDIVYYDLAAPSQLENTYLISSTDGGETFSAPRLLSSAPSDTTIRPTAGFGQGPSSGSQLVASEDENTYTAWTDSRRGDRESAKLDIFFTRVDLTLPDPPEPAEDDSEEAAFEGCPVLSANVIRGTAARNSIVGTARADEILAGDGNDFVDGLAGDDCIDLGAGADRGRGGSGADLMLGEAGADRMAGSGGADRISGGAARDRLSGGPGRDRLAGGGGGDRLSGGPAGDRLAGGSSGDRIAGHSGDDSIQGNAGADRLRGGSGRDRLSGGSGGDRILTRDRRRDRVGCGSGRDVVVADARDRVARDCERVRRAARR